MFGLPPQERLEFRPVQQYFQAVLPFPCDHCPPILGLNRRVHPLAARPARFHLGAFRLLRGRPVAPRSERCLAAVSRLLLSLAKRQSRPGHPQRSGHPGDRRRPAEQWHFQASKPARSAQRPHPRAASEAATTGQARRILAAR